MRSRLLGGRQPHDHHRPDGVLWPGRIVVPVSGGGADRQALRTACRLAHPAKAEVLVVTVLEVARHLPLNANLSAELGAAEELLAAMEEAAASLQTKVQTQVLQAREAGPAVIDEARSWGADLMVMGLEPTSRFGEFVLGETGSQLLSGVECRLIIIREPLQPLPIPGSAPD